MKPDKEVISLLKKRKEKVYNLIYLIIGLHGERIMVYEQLLLSAGDGVYDNEKKQKEQKKLH